MKVKGFNNKEYYWKPKPINWNGKSKSKIQGECKKALSLFWMGDTVGEEQPVPSSKMRFDFVNFNKKIIVEVMGGQHYKYNKFFHNNNIFEFADSKMRDDKKKLFAEKNGFTFLEVKSVEELNRALLELSKG